MKPSHFIIVLALPLCALAEESGSDRAPVEPKSLPAPDQTVAVAKPAIKQLADGRMQIGKVSFDPKTREIRFPASVNMTEGLLEFLIVHPKGKVHEALFVSDVSATNLNIAFKLLRYPASRELYLKLEPDMSLSNVFEDATPEERAGSRIRINVEWLDKKKKKSFLVNDLVSHSATEKSMPAAPWIYGGSFVYDGKFVAEVAGDLVAIFINNAALINFSGKDNELDDVWLPHPNRIPAEGTNVTIVIAPFKKKEKP